MKNLRLDIIAVVAISFLSAGFAHAEDKSAFDGVFPEEVSKEHGVMQGGMGTMEIGVAGLMGFGLNGENRVDIANKKMSYGLAKTEAQRLAKRRELRALYLRKFGILGLTAASVADGALRISATLSGRDAGYSPLTSVITSSAIRPKAEPKAKAAEPAGAATSMSVE